VRLLSSLSDHSGRLLSNVLRIVMANREELVRLDLLDGLRAILANADHLETFSLRRFNARVVQSIASMRHVSPEAARTYRRKFFETIARELSTGNPAVRAVFLELRTEPPAYTYSGASRPDADRVLIPPALAEPFWVADGCAWDTAKNISALPSGRDFFSE
jgi:hypothetical protein